MFISVDPKHCPRLPHLTIPDPARGQAPAAYPRAIATFDCYLLNDYLLVHPMPEVRLAVRVIRVKAE
jgi:hypothetical protein